MENANKQMLILSLAGFLLLVISASLHTAIEFGSHTYFLTAIGIGVGLWLWRMLYLARSVVAIWVYGSLNFSLIIWFGFVDGFWNHTFKTFLYFLHNQYLPPVLAQLFKDPHIGGFYEEATGYMCFITGMLCAYFTIKMISSFRTHAR